MSIESKVEELRALGRAAATPPNTTPAAPPALTLGALPLPARAIPPANVPPAPAPAPPEGAPQVAAAMVGVDVAAAAATGACSDAQRLLSTVLPERGLRFVVGIKNKIPWPERVGTNEEVIRFGQQRDAESRDVYFAVAGYRAALNDKGKPSREGKHAIWHRCLRVEIDVAVPGEAREAHHHDSKAAAREALDAFVAQHGLPRPIVVDSGGGLHAYWPFDRDVAVTQWQPLADRLKQLAGNLAGPESTADAARILRLPGTHNYKPHFGAAGRVVTVVDWGDGASSPEAIAQMLGMQMSAAGQEPADADDLDEQVMALRGGTVPAALAALAGQGSGLQMLDPTAAWLLSRGDDNAILAVIDSMAPYFKERFFSGDKGVCARDDWMRAIFAFSNLTKARPSLHDALKIRVLSWSTASKQWKQDPKALEQFEEFWHSARSATLARLVEHAQGEGWQSHSMAILPAGDSSGSMQHAVQQLPPLRPRAVDAKAFCAFLAGKYSYAQRHDKFFNHESGALVSLGAVVRMEQAGAARWKIKSGKRKGKWAYSSVNHIMKDHRVIARLDDLQYMPGYPKRFQLDGKSVGNLYIPAHAVALAATPEEQALFDELLYTVLPLTDPDCVVFRRYLLDALAWLVQGERNRLPFAFVLTGTAGCGKSLLMNDLIWLVLGGEHVAQTTNGALRSPFNGYIEGVRAVIADDVNLTSSDGALSESFKTLITATRIGVHRKGKDPYDIHNTASFFFASNCVSPVHLDDDDRRYLVVRSPAARMPSDLADRAYRWLNGPRAAGVLRGWLLARDVSRFRPHEPMPMTQGRQEAIELGRSPPLQALVERADAGEFPFDLKHFTVADCLEVLRADGHEHLTTQGVARLLRLDPLNAVAIGRRRVQPRRCQAEPGPDTKPRVFVLKRDDPEKWKSAGEGFLRQQRERGAGHEAVPPPPASHGEGRM